MGDSGRHNRRDNTQHMHMPESLGTYEEIDRVRKLFLRMRKMTLANHVDICTVLQELFENWVPENAWLGIWHIHAIKYRLGSSVLRGYQDKLWVMRLGMPDTWRFYGLDGNHVHIAGDQDDHAMRGDYGFGVENWRIGNFVRLTDNEPGKFTGDDQATLFGDQGSQAEPFIILNEALLESLEIYVTTWLPAYLHTGQTTVHDSESESDNW
jgi:hypothetical protein